MTVTPQVFDGSNIFFQEDAVHHVMTRRIINLSHDERSGLGFNLANLAFSDQWAIDQNIPNWGLNKSASIVAHWIYYYNYLSQKYGTSAAANEAFQVFYQTVVGSLTDVLGKQRVGWVLRTHRSSSFHP